VLVDWRLCSQSKIEEERCGRVRVGVGWDRGRRLVRERDGRAIGAIAASSPMVFLLLLFLCCCDCDATIRLLFISGSNGKATARSELEC